MAGDRTRIRRYATAFEAHRDRSILENHGIAAIVTGEHTGTIISFPSSLVGPALEVATEHADEAVRILSEPPEGGSP